MKTQNKSIVFLSPLPPPFGGIATWTQTLLAANLLQDYQVTIVNNGLGDIQNKKKFHELYRLVRILRHLVKQLSKKPQVLHLNCSLSPVGVFRDWLCVLLAKLFKTAVVGHYHGDLGAFPGHRFYGLSQYFLAAIICRTHANIVMNQASFGEITQAKYRSENTYLLPNFIASDLFVSRLQKREQTGRIRAIFVGRIERNKGIAELLSAAKQLPQVDFYLFGNLSTDIKDIFLPAVNVYWRDAVSHQTIIEEMQQSDFLVFPSYSEGFPLVVLEAMTVGLPVIASNVGAIPDMIDENEGGYLIEPRNEQALALAINRLITQPHIFSTMGQYNQQKSYHLFRDTVVIKKLLTIYEQVS